MPIDDSELLSSTDIKLTLGFGAVNAIFFVGYMVFGAFDKNVRSNKTLNIITWINLGFMLFTVFYYRLRKDRAIGEPSLNIFSRRINRSAVDVEENNQGNLQVVRDVTQVTVEEDEREEDEHLEGEDVELHAV